MLCDWLRATFDLDNFEIHDVNGAIVWAVLAATCSRIKEYPVKLGSLYLSREAFEIRKFSPGDLVLGYSMSEMILNPSNRSLLFTSYPFLMCDCIEDPSIMRQTEDIGARLGVWSKT